MPRRKATATALATEEPSTATTATALAPEPPSRSEASAEGEAPHERRARRAAPPREILSATLGPSNDSPKMHLHRFFDHLGMTFDEAPGQKHQGDLEKAGWQPSNEERTWAKEIPQEGEKWQTAADAERLFKKIANEVRADQGLGPVLSL
jgi:hypothetical protein